MLDEISSTNCVILYGAYKKNYRILKQSEKEKIYINLLEIVVKDIDNQVEIIFDKFEMPQFEERIINTIKENNNVLSIKPMDSQKEPGLKLIDNVCGVIRLELSNMDTNNFYLKIKNHIKLSKIIEHIH